MKLAKRTARPRPAGHGCRRPAADLPVFVFVRRYGFGQEDCRLVPVSRLEALAGNRVDRERAGKTEEIKANYDMALAELRGDV